MHSAKVILMSLILAMFGASAADGSGVPPNPNARLKLRPSGVPASAA